VALVTMIDCPAPGYPKPPPAIVRMHAHARNFLSLSMRERLSYLGDRAAHRIKVARRALGAPPLSVDTPTLSPTLRRVVAALDEIYARYVPAPLGVDVLFLCAAVAPDWPATAFDDPLMGWGDVLRGRIFQAETPGAHAEIFRPGNVEVLVEHLRHAIACVDDGALELSFDSRLAQA
jgi:thioesterase domain-containing protein